MALDDAAADAQAQSARAGWIAIHNVGAMHIGRARGEQNLHQHALGEQAGRDHDGFLGSLRRGFLGVHQQVQQHLFELARRSHHDGALGRELRLRLHAFHFPLGSAEFQKARKNRVQIHAAHFALFHLAEGDQSAKRSRKRAGLRRGWSPSSCLGALAVPRLDHGGQRHDGVQRRPQLVGHARNQLARRRQFFTSKELLAHGVLLLERQRGRDLIGQVLHGGLLGSG